MCDRGTAPVDEPGDKHVKLTNVFKDITNTVDCDQRTTYYTSGQQISILRGSTSDVTMGTDDFLLKNFPREHAALDHEHESSTQVSSGPVSNSQAAKSTPSALAKSVTQGSTKNHGTGTKMRLVVGPSNQHVVEPQAVVPFRLEQEYRGNIDRARMASNSSTMRKPTEAVRVWDIEVPCFIGTEPFKLTEYAKLEPSYADFDPGDCVLVAFTIGGYQTPKTDSTPALNRASLNIQFAILLASANTDDAGPAMERFPEDLGDETALGVDDPTPMNVPDGEGIDWAESDVEIPDGPEF
ncbi:uncharacterized protein EV420DRAFT_1488281 [Desarmillaria tabescens]|uniref:Uncharacterized protein n=1 Tax=Armillaria tabescens TaxID=1929756 RepID=A0AA39MIF4_ARMTA|nr:uncharacterized protein EV420DRAFT_1488281 [Desarmillaria tabescens]KAK0435003.1 hypothetical protein EV420DRAFT_1488281 [Desarmillaria tabescens]